MHKGDESEAHLTWVLLEESHSSRNERTLQTHEEMADMPDGCTTVDETVTKLAAFHN